MKILKFITIFSCFQSLVCEEFYLTNKSYRCTSSNRTVIDYKCFMKSYSRTFQTINISFNLTKKVTHVKVVIVIWYYRLCLEHSFFQFDYDLQHRYLTPYYNTVINSTFDACRFLNGSDQNLVAKMILGLFRSSLDPNFIHSCPYSGYINLPNITANLKAPFISQFIYGTYRAITRGYNEDDDNIITIFYEVELSRKRSKTGWNFNSFHLFCANKIVLD